MNSSSQRESASYKIFVGGLDSDTKEEDLTEYFSKFGRVVERLIKVDIKTKRSRGFAFIGFKSPDAVDKVLEVDEHWLHGKKIDCKRAMTKEDAYSLNKTLKESCRKVFISNIPRELSKKDLFDYFKEYGRINDFNLIFKKKETGFLYIIFDSEEEALNLIEKKFVDIKGCRLEIQKAIPKDVKESPEDDSNEKAIHSYQHNQVPRQRGSYELQFGYDPLYTSTNNPIVMGGHHPNQSPYNYYEPTHRMPESASPYSQPGMVHHGQAMPADARYHGGRVYPPQTYAGATGNDPTGMHRAPHRNRVRSEQAINTLSPMFMTPPATMYRNDHMQVIPRSRMGVHSFSHVSTAGFGLHYAAMPDNNERIAQPREQTSNSPAHEFIENEMNFKTFRPKESPSKSESNSAQKKESGSPLVQNEKGSRQAKQAKIKSIEEEIKATKEKLKTLEDLLKQEYATVSEGPSNNEGQSHSSNNE